MVDTRAEQSELKRTKDVSSPAQKSKDIVESAPLAKQDETKKTKVAESKQTKALQSQNIDIIETKTTREKVKKSKSKKEQKAKIDAKEPSAKVAKNEVVSNKQHKDIAKDDALVPQNTLIKNDTPKVEVAAHSQDDAIKEAIDSKPNKSNMPKSNAQTKSQTRRNPLLQSLSTMESAEIKTLKDSKKDDKRGKNGTKAKQTSLDSVSKEAKLESKAQTEPLTTFEEILQETQTHDSEETLGNVAKKHKERQETKTILNDEPKDSKTQPKESSQTQVSTQTNRTQMLYRSALARESIRNFANTLREEVLNYKPPVTRLSMELHPQNLGTLELTISKKGKDLHVQVLSNATAVGLFMQNQADFRNNLAQMGFENVDLSFSSFEGNANNGSGKNATRDNQKGFDENEGNKNSLQNVENDMQIMNITLPKYA